MKSQDALSTFLCPTSKAAPHLPDTEAPSEDLAGTENSAEKGHKEEEQRPPATARREGGAGECP